MNEGMFYALYFLAIIFNYTVKLKLESDGARVERSNLREGIICGVSVYLLYQALVIPQISLYLKVLNVVLGIFSLAACAFFFLKSGRPVSDDGNSADLR